ncbi:MAG TPA: glucokinase [Chloroflexota bacterium]|nr:glucokinase [Chloroflexota bacterium]
MLLAGDLGGTKTNLAIYDPLKGERAPVAEATFPSGQFPSLEALVQTFLAKVDYPIERASFGVAGPVVHGKARITNLPWTMDQQEMAKTLRLKSVRLLNDLEAIGTAIPFLRPEDIHTLTAGEPVPHGNMAVIAPGTGLGEAFLTWEGTRYHTHASEGGHADFAPTNPDELALLSYLLKRMDHVSYERVCSGHGLPNIYAFLRDSGFAAEPTWLAEKLAAAPDPTPVIVQAGLRDDSALGEAPNPLCVATLRTFVSIMGAEAGNLALKVMATGGVYVGGGIPPRILPLLEHDGFMLAFRQKGRFADLLNRVPVHVILNPKIALIGAAVHGLQGR